MRILTPEELEEYVDVPQDKPVEPTLRPASIEELQEFGLSDKEILETTFKNKPTQWSDVSNAWKEYAKKEEGLLSVADSSASFFAQLPQFFSSLIYTATPQTGIPESPIDNYSTTKDTLDIAERMRFKQATAPKFYGDTHITEGGKLLTDAVGTSIDFIGDAVAEAVRHFAGAPELGMGEATEGSPINDAVAAVISETIKLKFYAGIYKYGDLGIFDAVGKKIALQKAINDGRLKGDYNHAIDLIKKELWDTKSEMVDAYKEKFRQRQDLEKQIQEMLGDVPREQYPHQQPPEVARLTKQAQVLDADMQRIAFMKENFITFDITGVKEGTQIPIGWREPSITDRLVYFQMNPRPAVESMKTAWKQPVVTEETKMEMSKNYYIDEKNYIRRNKDDSIVSAAEGEWDQAYDELVADDPNAFQKGIIPEKGKPTGIKRAKDGTDVYDTDSDYLDAISEKETVTEYDTVPTGTQTKPFKAQKKTTSVRIDLLEDKKQKYLDFTRDDAPGVYVNALIQNSLDAIDQKKIKDGKLIVEITKNGDGTSTIIFADNGIGMPPDIVDNNFLVISSKGTKGSETRGGYGNDKVVLLGYPITYKVESWAKHEGSKTGTSYTVISGKKEDFFSSNENIKFVSKEGKKGADSGTRFEITIDEGDTQKFIDAFQDQMTNLHSPVEIFMKKPGDTIYKNTKTKDFYALPGDNEKIYFDYNNDTQQWDSEVAVKFVPRTKEQRSADIAKAAMMAVPSYKIEWQAFNRGMKLPLRENSLQFETLLDPAPWDIYINFEKTKPAGHENYPFAWNRQDLTWNSAYYIREKINYFIREINKKIKQKHNEEFDLAVNNAERVNGIVTLIPFKDEVSIKETRELFSKNKELFDDLTNLFSNFGKELKGVGEKNIEIGLTTADEAHGYWIKRGDKELYLVNPWTITDEMPFVTDYQKAINEGVDYNNIRAANLVGTMIHEYCHDYAKGHEVPFTQKYHFMSNILEASDATDRLKILSRRLYENYSGTIDRLGEDLRRISETGNKLSVFHKTTASISASKTGGETGVNTNPSILGSNKQKVIGKPQFIATDGIAEKIADLKKDKQDLVTATPEEAKEITKRILSSDAYEEIPEEMHLNWDYMTQKAMEGLNYETEGIQQTFKTAKDKNLTLSVRLNKNGMSGLILTQPAKLSKDILHSYEFFSVKSAQEFLKNYSKEMQIQRYYDAVTKDATLAPDLIKEGGIKKIVDKKKIDDQFTKETPVPRADLIVNELGKDYWVREKIEDWWKSDKPKRIGIWNTYFAPMKPVIEKIEARTGIQLFSRFMDIQDGIRKEHLISIPYLKRINNAQRGMSLKDSEFVYKLLEAKDLQEEKKSFGELKKDIMSNKELREKFEYIRPEHHEAAKKINTILHEAGLEYGISLADMVKDYAPRIRKSGMTIEQAEKLWRVPEEYKWWADEARSGYLNPHETDIFKVARAYVQKGARKKAIGSQIEELANIMNKANNVLDPREKTVLTKFYTDLRGWPADVDGALRITTNNIVHGINKAINVVTGGRGQRYQNIVYEPKTRMKFIEGVRVEEIRGWKEIDRRPGFFNVDDALTDLVNLHLNLTYAGALGLRPMALIRNAVQSMLIMPVVGFRHWSMGLAKALTREGLKECKANGILLDDYLPLGGEVDAMVTNYVESIAQKTMWAYTKVDNFNRAVSYHAMKHRMLEFGEEYMRQLPDVKNARDLMKLRQDFIRESDLEFFSNTLIKNEVIPLLNAKDMEALAQRMGRHASENTQWIYRRANSPVFMKGKSGKLLGQFGTWPLWYVQYGKELAFRGSKANIAKRLAYFAAINTSLEQIGEKVFGVDISGWVWHYPALWSMGLAASTVSSMAKAVSNNPQESSEGRRDLLNSMGMYLPTYLEINNIVKAFDESRTEDQVKRGLGFKPSR